MMINFRTAGNYPKTRYLKTTKIEFFDNKF